MSKKLNKAISGGLIITTVLSSTTTKVEADAAAVLEMANETAMVCPYVAPLIVSGALVVTGITTIIGIKQQDAKEEVIYKSYSHLPDRWRPGSVVEKINPQGKCIQRRFYGQDGLPMFDVDMNNHGMPDAHPFGNNGAHKHIFNNKIRNKDRRRQKGVELTNDEYQRYVKDFDRSRADRMRVRYIEDAK